MFWLIYVTVNIQDVLLWLECRYGDVYIYIPEIPEKAQDVNDSRRH